MTRFEEILREAARDHELDEALGALAKVARAAGCWPETCAAQSVAEVGDIIAAKVAVAWRDDNGVLRYRRPDGTTGTLEETELG